MQKLEVRAQDLPKAMSFSLFSAVLDKCESSDLYILGIRRFGIKLMKICMRGTGSFTTCNNKVHIEQGVSCSQKYCVKHGVPNYFEAAISQFGSAKTEL